MFTKIVESMIFYPTRSFLVNPEYFNLEYEDIFFETDDNVTLHGWYFNAPRKETFLFFHGNAGNISDRLDNVVKLVKTGFPVFIFDYRGYGKSLGSPTEKGTYKDASAAWKVLIEQKRVVPSDVILFGRSLGGAIAVDLAVKKKPGFVILESTFTSVRELSSTILPLFPQIIVPDIYPSIRKIGSVKSPVLFIHGTRDSLIPFRHGQKLYEKAGNPKDFYAVEGGDHNDTYIVAGTEYFERLTTFIDTGGQMCQR